MLARSLAHSLAPRALARSRARALLFGVKIARRMRDNDKPSVSGIVIAKITPAATGGLSSSREVCAMPRFWNVVEHTDCSAIPCYAALSPLEAALLRCSTGAAHAGRQFRVKGMHNVER